MARQIERPVIFDFGMHEGEDTEFYLECGARVVAFEANRDLVQRNSAHFAKDLASGNLEIVSGAIVPPDFVGKTQTFFLDDGKSVWGTTQPGWADRNTRLGSSITAVEVPVVDLNRVMAEAPSILYAKIDIEGADRFVLDTFRATAVRPEFLSIESDKLGIESVIEEIEILQDLGYTRFAAVQQATIPGSTLRSHRFDGSSLNYRFKKHSSGPFGPYLGVRYKPAHEVIAEYRSIFRSYARYGDRSWLMQGPLRQATRALNYVLLKAIGRPLCGWYDTHAAR